MRFLVDNQLPPALARFIAQDLGVEALHVADVGLRNETDENVWGYASGNDLVLITKDEDFVSLYTTAPTARLLWGPSKELPASVLAQSVSRAMAEILDYFEHGEKFVELR